ncbi:DNA repair protein [Vibrio parahaemolyticus]|nr:DNA repair protein [Vibrio parahaemolyticus]
MRVGTMQLYKIGLKSLKSFETDEYFDLYSYQALLKPMLDEYYCTDEHIERFNNQSYRILKILEQEEKVVRLSPPRINNAQFVAIGGTKVTQEKHRVGQGYLEPEPVSEERQYQDQLNTKIVEINDQIVAHKELLDLFPAHGEHLNNEIEKLEREVLLTEYKKEIIGKIINQEKR